VSSVINPVPVPAGGGIDLVALVVFSTILFPLALNNKRRIVRSEGILLFVGYVAYMAWRSFGGS
jgi:Ca2+/Na+ antiporter